MGLWVRVDRLEPDSRWGATYQRRFELVMLAGFSCCCGADVASHAPVWAAFSALFACVNGYRLWRGTGGG